ncbi:hypothetical protein K438DRAFT_2020600 [Mycena galopus ATCC 62051]|nr:hypothetical protein K438DRAFT_2020600 [Mycena galopus ATCC 62051]
MVPYRYLHASSRAVSPLVTPGEYAFQLDGEPAEYKFPICRTFSYWEPPAAEDLPEDWLFDHRDFNKDNTPLTRPSDVTGVVWATDHRCVMTREDGRLDCTHLVPKTAAKWFRYYGLWNEAGDGANNTVDSPNNNLMLRSDLTGCGLDRGDYPTRTLGRRFG